MLMRSATAIALTIALHSGGLLAQTRPDFSGTWEMDLTRSESAAQAGDAAVRKPIIAVITQTPAQVTVEERTERGTVVNAYPLPGNVPEPVGTAGQDPRNAKWNGAALVTMRVDRVSGMAVRKIETRTVDASGQIMTVQTQLNVEHGYASNGGREASGGAQPNSNIVKDIYVRKAK